MKALSIIVPTYNVELYLDRCLSSLPTDRVDLEVLVIIDGSKDNSTIIAKSYKDKFPEVFKVIEKENGHYGSCVNVGLSLASGKYVKVLDADDYFCTENVSDYLDFAEKSKADLILSNSGRIKNGIHDSYYSFNLPGYKELELKELTNNYLYSLPHQCLAYRKDLIDSINYHQTEGCPYTDLEWVMFPMRAVSTIAFFPAVIYEYDLSREGQSVSEAVHCKEIEKDCRIVLGVASYYEQYKTCVPEENRRVMREVAVSNVTRIYFHHLINFPKSLTNEGLVQFDKELRTISPELYQIVDPVLERRKFMTFDYIHNWRKHSSRRTLTFAFFDMGVAIGRIVDKIK